MDNGWEGEKAYSKGDEICPESHSKLWQSQKWNPSLLGQRFPNSGLWEGCRWVTGPVQRGDGWKASPPGTHSTVAVPVPQGWTQLPFLAIAIYRTGLQCHSSLAWPNLSGTVTPHTRSQHHSVTLGPAIPLRGVSEINPKWHCNPMCQVSTPRLGSQTQCPASVLWLQDECGVGLLSNIPSSGASHSALGSSARVEGAAGSGWCWCPSLGQGEGLLPMIFTTRTPPPKKFGPCVDHKKKAKCSFSVLSKKFGIHCPRSESSALSVRVQWEWGENICWESKKVCWKLEENTLLHLKVAAEQGFFSKRLQGTHSSETKPTLSNQLQFPIQSWRITIILCKEN